MADRLQKLLSQYGIASRRAAEQMILAGRVRLNGAPAQLGDTADLTCDTVEVDGVVLQAPPEKLTVMLNKPRGYVTTASDEKGRKTVLELVTCTQRLYPVGRLDMYSEGLLLLTNDGELANKITHPKREIEKVYRLWVSGYETGKDTLLRNPIEIDDRLIQPPGVRLLSESAGVAELEIVIHEGRNRQIRRMCLQAGLTVTRLKRVGEGALRLGNLKPGCWRELTYEELQYLNSL